jgi:hypothetical protein
MKVGDYITFRPAAAAGPTLEYRERRLENIVDDEHGYSLYTFNMFMEGQYFSMTMSGDAIDKMEHSYQPIPAHLTSSSSSKSSVSKKAKVSKAFTFSPGDYCIGDLDDVMNSEDVRSFNLATLEGDTDIWQVTSVKTSKDDNGTQPSVKVYQKKDTNVFLARFDMDAAYMDSVETVNDGPFGAPGGIVGVILESHCDPAKVEKVKNDNAGAEERAKKEAKAEGITKKADIRSMTQYRNCRVVKIEEPFECKIMSNGTVLELGKFKLKVPK